MATREQSVFTVIDTFYPLTIAIVGKSGVQAGSDHRNEPVLGVIGQGEGLAVDDAGGLVVMSKGGISLTAILEKAATRK